ncbi:MAG TPA: HEAT repeat domain-containing protein [Luteolibacter sp.]|nr:HEAT repeat domain-containing protein [Luteolibacter sp.]
MNRIVKSIVATVAAATPLQAGTKVFQTFDGDGFDDWKFEGKAFGVAPVAGKTPEMNGEFKNYSGEYLACSANGGDGVTGSLTSAEITLVEPYIAFLVGGGNHAGKTAVQLLVEGKVVREATGKNDLEMRATVWDVRDFKGKKAQIRLLDEATGTWGIIAADHFIFTDYPNQKFPSSTRGGKSYSAGLINDPNLPGVTIPENTTLKVIADWKDQKTISPTALAIDEQNNIFLSETHRFRFGVQDNREHLYWYLDDLQSQEPGDRRKMHEKWKEKVSIESLTAKSELIRKLVDKDGDGVYETSTVFADGFNDVLDGTAAGVFAFEGTTYFACIPKIWALRDENGDGVADQKKVVEEGFGIRVSISGHDLNGFVLGPDGRIYGTCGDRGLSFTTKDGKKYHYPNEGVAFRFEPDGTGFEIFHTGLRNPKEIAFDKYGNPFSVDNNSDQGDAARVVYLMEGGDTGWQMENQTMHTFHRQIGLANRPPSRWMNEKMWELRNESQPAYLLPAVAHLTAGPSGLTYHPGTGFLETEDNHFLVCDYRGSGANSGIFSFEMTPKGAGMEMTDNRKLSWGIGATDVEYSYDGKLIVTDFMNGWTSHDKGRVLALSAGDKTWRAKEAAEAGKLIKDGIGNLPAADVAKLLKHPDMRVRLRAQIALTRKPDALKTFKESVKSADQMERIHSLWGLGILARRGPVPVPNNEGFANLPDQRERRAAAEEIIPFLEHADEETRVQAIRAISTSGVPADALPLSVLTTDKSLRVRSEAAIALGRMGTVSQFNAICEMLRENDNKDVYLRHAGIFALQKFGEKGIALSALKSDKSAAVRLAAVVAMRRLQDPKVWLLVSDADPAVSDEAVRAIYDNNLNEQRPFVAKLLDDLKDRKWTPFMMRRLIHNSFRIGDAENLQRVLNVATDASQPQEVREEALRLISIWTEPHTNDQLTGHYRPLPARKLEDIQPTLNAALPGLLKQEGFVLTAALGFMEHYKLDTKSLDEATLRSLINNTKVPAEARAKGLDLLVERKPADLTAFLAKVAVDPANEVAISALNNLAKSDHKAAIAPLEAAIDSNNAERAQKGWTILTNIPGADVDGFFVKHLGTLKAATGKSASAIELIEGAKTRKDPAVAAALADFEKTLAANPDPLAKWNISLEGGDPKNGFSLFSTHPASQCMRCHRASDDSHAAGGDAGPNLFGIGKRHDAHYLLEAMINPSAKIAPGFGVVMVTFKDKTTLGGTLVEEGGDYLDINVSGKVWRVKKADLAEIPPAASAMPPMEYLLKPGEVRDLVAWLGTLQKEMKQKPGPKPAPYDPKNPPAAPKAN